jgi:alpha-tubulin suppressor-like RCC1 family protein
MMKVLRRSRRPAQLAGCAVLTLALAGTAVGGSPAALAQVTGPVLDQHAAVSWGDNEAGQLGNEATDGGVRYGGVSGLGGGVVQVSAGAFHGLALRSDGTVWAWGGNGWGQLGDGTVTSRSTPVQVPGLTGVVQVAAGVAQSLALRSDGTVWAWGFNADGQVGNGTSGGIQLTPVEETGLTGVTKISAGGGFSLALRSDGTVWAWGFGLDGELGNGTAASSPVPVQVTGLADVTGISAGFGGAALATRTNGITVLTSVWAWGYNDSGQLGDGTFTSHLTPERVTGIGTSYIAGIGAGQRFSVVLGTDGSVWAWGADDSGQLGSTPAGNPVTRPVQTIGMNSGITQLSAGQDHVLALRSNGTVLAWGGNSNGQLGNGGTAGGTGPVQVSGLAGASQVSAGAQFSLAVARPPLTSVPDLSGDTTPQAGQALQAAGLVLGTVNTAIDNFCNNIGTVMSQNPAAGTAVSFGSAVSITIGQRPPHPCL